MQNSGNVAIRIGWVKDERCCKMTAMR